MKSFNTLLFTLLLMAVVGQVQAQTPFDAIMMKQREFCIAAVYEHNWFDEYWEGTYLRTNETIATVKRDMVMPMLAFGIFDRLTSWSLPLMSAPLPANPMGANLPAPRDSRISGWR